MNQNAGKTSGEQQRLAERVRAALVHAALDAYEDAAVRGLCCEGAWEVAVAAMRGLDLGPHTTAAPLPEP
ncbi:MAG TPA: hypothetical protein VFG66_12940 [Gemmatimonadales bacterium]|nr:hypothetical protein [Gemmatimonadales bacterium]